MAMRFVRTKLVAVFLGTAGTGFLGQLVLFFETLRIWATLGTRRAVIRQISKTREEGPASPAYRRAVTSSFALVALSSLVLVAAVVALARPISKALYGDPGHSLFVAAAGIALPIAAVSVLLSAILKGNLEVRPFAKASLAAYGAVLLLTPPLVYFFRLWGAFFVYVLFFGAPLAAYLVLNARRRFLYFSDRVDARAVVEQVSDGFNFVYAEMVSALVRVVVATWITKRLGLDAMGLYQTVITFTTVYLAIPQQSISGYTIPLIAGAKTDRELGDAVNDTLRYLYFILIPVITFLAAWPGFVIDFFYAPDFRAAAPVLRLQLVGTCFGVVGHSCASALVAKGRLGPLYAASTLSQCLFFGLSWLFIRKFGLMGPALAFVIAQGSVTLHLFLSIRRLYGFRIEPKNFRLLAASAAWFGLAQAAAFGGTAARCGATAFGLVWFWFASKDHERRYLWDRFTRLVRRA
jgi:PST family polysaccharide transporter